MSGALRIAVVGGGTMGANHVRVLSQHPDTELVGLVDTDAERGADLAARFAIPHVADLDMLGSLDGAVVAVPTEHHRRVAEPLLAAGVPLLVEKPLAAELTDVEALMEASRSTSTPLMCGFVERFNPAVATARALLEGSVVHVGAVRHSPATARIRTSVVHDLLIHDIDLAIRLVGMPVLDEVQSTTWAGASGVTDLADCLLGFEGGAVANLSSSRVSQRKVRSVSVATEEMLLEIDLLRHDLTVYRHRAERQLDQDGPTYRAETVVDIPFVRHEGEPLVLQLDHFVSLLRGVADPSAELDTLTAPHEVAARVASGPCLRLPERHRTRP